MRFATVTLLLAAASVAPSARAQVTPCTFDKGDPHCNRAAFQKTLAAARTVSYNQDKLDPYAAKQLLETISTLGKRIVPADDHPALYFELSQPGTDGVYVGPAGVVLARLRVYGPGRNGPLLWEESYRDQPDVPWQSAVLYVLRQFRERFPG